MGTGRGRHGREVLNALAIMTYDETGSFQGSSTLTRAQLAKIVVMSSALRGSVGESTSVSPFYDVPYTHWAAPYIAMARDNAMMRRLHRRLVPARPGGAL